jgi:catechol 2,3-dioxygenase-like lactoylglutathione lyase family enzyme
MLANVPVCVSLPTTNLVRARRFYEVTLGLPIMAVGGPEPGNPHLGARVVYRTGNGTMLSLYERPPSRSELTAAFFIVDDFDRTIAELRARGLVLQDYDPGGSQILLEDPSGNVIELFQPAGA